VAAAALLAACGGDDAPPLQATAQRSAAATTLLDDLGQPMPLDGTTTTNDTAVRALGVRLASRQQADQLQAALPDETISVDAGCCWAGLSRPSTACACWPSCPPSGPSTSAATASSTRCGPGAPPSAPT
jgi:hypothetical protein